MSTAPFVISQNAAVMRTITQRIATRENVERIARRNGMATKKFRSCTTHVAKLGRNETVESNLPLQ
jgi:hypothetical protein